MATPMRNIENGIGSGSASLAAPAPAPAEVRELTDTLLFILPFPEYPEIMARIRAAHPKLKIIYHYLKNTTERDCFFQHVEVPAEIFKDVTILVTLAQLPKPEDAPKLEIVHIFSAGINHLVNNPLYRDTSVTFTTSSGIHGPQIAEHIFMTLLAVTHRLPLMLSWQREHRWAGRTDLDAYHGAIYDLVGQRLGVLGYGSIGRQAANVARAMGMRVDAYTASPRPTPESRRDTGYIVPGTGDPDGTIPERWFSGLDKASLRGFLASGIDVLLIAVPLTPETLHFIAKEELDILSRPGANGKKGTFLVNIARGPIVDHAALLDALKAGLDPDRPDGLSGASLDVTEPEPLGEDSELWGLKNTIITPHVSGTGATYRERCLEVLEMNLMRRKNGEKLVNAVDRKRGY